MMSSRRAKASIWRCHSGVSDKSGTSASARRFRGAIMLQQLRHDVFTKHKIGENDARQPLLNSRHPRDDFFNECDSIGGHGRHAGKRQLNRHRPRCCESRTRGTKCGPFLRRLGDDARLHRPAGNAGTDARQKMRHRRQHELHRTDPRAHTRDGVAKDLKQQANFARQAAATSGQTAARRAGVRPRAPLGGDRPGAQPVGGPRRCKAARRGAGAPPARTAGLPARNRHGAHPPRPDRQAQTEGET